MFCHQDAGAEVGEEGVYGYHEDDACQHGSSCPSYGLDYQSPGYQGQDLCRDRRHHLPTTKDDFHIVCNDVDGSDQSRKGEDAVIPGDSV